MSDPTYMQNFLHPPKKPPKPAVKVMKDGREICDQLTKAGRDEYERRKRLMWERQKRRCCLEGHVEGCPGVLRWQPGGLRGALGGVDVEGGGVLGEVGERNLHGIIFYLTRAA